jgi:SAM-dependent methyltransferase
MKWFERWFDTEYYHLLYKHRNYEEASVFIGKLLDFLALNPGDKAVDIGCGKGRHSMVLAELGLQVLGLDLSENSIAFASKQKEELQITNVDFLVHDMREKYPIDGLQAVFNLFTSFGYFDDSNDDRLALCAMADSLADSGFVVQDYLNAAPLVARANEGVLQPLEWQIIEGVKFGIEKFIADGKIFKRILVEDLRASLDIEQPRTFEFQEEVKIYTPEALQSLHSNSGLCVVKIFGNYNLDEFNKDFSPRIIVVSKKNSILPT